MHRDDPGRQSPLARRAACSGGPLWTRVDLKILLKADPSSERSSLAGRVAGRAASCSRRLSVNGQTREPGSAGRCRAPSNSPIFGSATARGTGPRATE